MNTIRGREDILIKDLLRDFSNPTYLNVFKKIVLDEKLISLRLLDCFATNYSRNKIIWINNVDIHEKYKQKLKSHTKKFFDPFCRRQRIIISGVDIDIQNDEEIQEVRNKKECVKLEYKFIKYDKKIHKKKIQNGIVTTIGQLNFFKWCIEYNILEYIVQHHQEIEEYMTERKIENEIINVNRLKSKSKLKKTRNQTFKSDTNFMIHRIVKPCQISFK